MSRLGEEFEKLVEVMTRLRASDGCPWDREQTHESLKKYLIEEVYEFIDAVDSKDTDGMRDELGDILLQVVFHSQIAKDEGEFDIESVVVRLTEKLIKRHPHIFSDKSAESPEDVEVIWEENKQREREDEAPLSSLPKFMPALLRARRAGERMAGFGFDWKRAEDVMEKIIEEIDELKEAVSKEDREKREWEVGDLLFVIANLSRKLNIDPEEALNKTVDRAIRRFTYIWHTLEDRGIKPNDATLEDMEKLWQEAKDIVD